MVELLVKLIFRLIIHLAMQKGRELVLPIIEQLIKRFFR